VKTGPLVFAVILAAFLAVRWKKLEPTLKVGGVLAVLGLLVYGSGLVHPPNVKTVVEDAGTKLGRWTYLVVTVAAFFETGAFVGLIAPGETFLIFGGVVAGQGTVSLVALIALVWTAAVAGDLVSFFAGRRLGRSFLVRHGPKISITEERLETVEAFFDKYGGRAIFLGRFVGLVRAVNPFLAGSSGMPLRRFLPYDVVGAGLWATLLLVLGYIFWQSFDRVLHYAEQGTLALGTTIVVLAVIVWLVRRFRDEDRRREAMAWVDQQLDRPVLRPVAVVVRPVGRFLRGPLRFLWLRLTPGELGLELTTLLAVAAVGSFAFLANLMTLQDQKLVAGDAKAFQIVDDLRMDWVDDAAKGITDLGSPPVVGTAVALTVVLLVYRRRIMEAAALASGMVLTYVAVHVTKSAEGRPRPAGALVEASGDSYPSAHAAYAVAWVAIAVVLTRTLPGLARTAAAIVAAVVLAAGIGLTRVVLRAHYLSDVVGGWGVAAGLFALCGMAALVIVHVRNNAVRA
jgi:undecaprenyl-diphosphatase